MQKTKTKRTESRYARKQAATRAATGTGTLDQQRKGMLDRCNAAGLNPDQVYRAVGVEGLHDLKIEHLRELASMLAQIRAGEVAVEDVRRLGEEPSSSLASRVLASRSTEQTQEKKEP